jgi:hypothetical protein
MIKWLNILLIVLLFVSCKKAFTPPGALSSTSKYLVIEGVINSGNDSTFINLSRTKIFDTVVSIDVERGAQVSVESDANNSYPLMETAPGTYSSAPLNLDNTHKYRLNIKTTDNKNYVSDFVAVKNSPPIDSVGFKAQQDGVHIYVNSHDGANATRYYRWEYSEAWQFHSYYESFWVGISPRMAADYRYQCYTNDVSKSILISSTAKLSEDVVYQAPIATLPSTSEKIETKYTILVKQYALTSDAYSFWQNLQSNTNQLGSIFDAQPTQNQSNYHCLSNPAEIVIGYLSVGNVTTKRIFITANQLLPSYGPLNVYGCSLDTAYYFHDPSYLDPAILGPNSGNTTVDGIYASPSPPFGLPNYVTYSKTICDDCTVRGSLNPPPFWQ